MNRKNIKIRIDGIYDQRTFTALQGLGIDHFAFDFRPLSFNFLPQHRFFEMLEKSSVKSNYLFLKYEGEKDFVILKMLSDLQEKFGPLNKNIGPLAKTCLEFSDFNKINFYEQFATPFWWHLTHLTLNDLQKDEVKQILKSPLLRGIVIKWEQLKSWIERGEWPAVKMKFRSDCLLMINSDWDYTNEIIETRFDFLLSAFMYYSLPINEEIEICYRNVDLFKLSSGLKKLPPSIFPFQTTTV